MPEDGTNEALADAGSTPAASPAGGPETPNRLEENGPWLRGPLRGPANAPIEDPSRALAGGAPPHEGAGVGLAAPAPHSPREAELGAQPVPWGCSQGHPKPALRPLCAALVLTWVLPTSPAMCSPCSNSRLRGGTPSRCSRARLGTARTPPHTQAALSSCSAEDLGYLPWLHLGRGQLVHACPSEKATVAKSRANKDGL